MERLSELDIVPRAEQLWLLTGRSLSLGTQATACFLEGKLETTSTL